MLLMTNGLHQGHLGCPALIHILTEDKQTESLKGAKCEE